MAAPPVPPPQPDHPRTTPYPAYTPIYYGNGPFLPGQCGIRPAMNAAARAPMPPAQPCTSIVLGTMNAHRTGFGMPGGPFPEPEFAQLPFGTPGHAHTVCYHCNRISENMPWYRLAATRIMHEPPPPADETNRWRGLLTRMCRRCERRERFLMYSRSVGAGFVVPPLPPSPAAQAQMYNYPWNTCTCKNALDAGRLCRNERQAHWDQLRTRLVHQRNRTKNWLFRIALAPQPHARLHLRTSSPQRHAHRILLTNNHCLRACRCGAEVTMAVPRVWQCMACEGIVEASGVPRLTTAQVIAAPPSAIVRINSASVGRPLRFYRPRSAVLH